MSWTAWVKKGISKTPNLKRFDKCYGENKTVRLLADAYSEIFLCILQLGLNTQCRREPHSVGAWHKFCYINNLVNFPLKQKIYI